MIEVPLTAYQHNNPTMSFAVRVRRGGVDEPFDLEGLTIEFYARQQDDEWLSSPQVATYTLPGGIDIIEPTTGEFTVIIPLSITDFAGQWRYRVDTVKPDLSGRLTVALGWLTVVVP